MEFYTRKGYIVTVIPTSKPKEGIDIVMRYAQDYDTLVVSGGDGTLNEAVSGVMTLEKRPIIGYIPSGTMNDFASSLHISKELIHSVQTIIDGVPFECDVGTMNGHVFNYIAAFGLFTDVAYQTSREAKSVLGRMAYILEGAKRLGKIPEYRLKITTENETIEDSFIYGMITNSSSVGGFKGLGGQNVELDDGLFEVLLARKPQNMVELQGLLQCVLTATPDPTCMYTLCAAKIEIQSETPVDWTLDGEFGGSIEHAIIENHMRAISIIVKTEES